MKVFINRRHQLCLQATWLLAGCQPHGLPEVLDQEPISDLETLEPVIRNRSSTFLSPGPSLGGSLAVRLHWPDQAFRKVQFTARDVDRFSFEVSTPQGLKYASVLETTAVASASAPGVTFRGLPPGEVEVLATALLSNGGAIGQGSATASISAGATASAAIAIWLSPSFVPG